MVWSNNVLNYVFFFALCLEAVDVICLACATRMKPPLAATQAFGLRTQAAPPLSSIERPPVHYDTRGSMVPAIVRDCQELCFELVPRKVKRREVWRARRLKLHCAVPHCPLMVASQPGSVRRRVLQDQQKLTPKLHEGCAIGHNVLVNHLDPLLTVDFQPRIHEVQRWCNVKSAYDARDHDSSRGRRL